jgi:hypothetical protein
MNLTAHYTAYVAQMDRCYMADVRRYGPDCANAFVPQTFEQWAASAVEVKHNRYVGFYVAVWGEKVGPAFKTFQEARTYRQALV